MKIEPPVAERRWYQHVVSGDRGYVVTDEDTGLEWMRYDRPGQQYDVPFHTPVHKNTWMEDKDAGRPLTRWHIAHVCQAASAALSYAQGDHAAAHVEWNEIINDPKAMRFWRNVGPKEDPAQKALFHAIRKSLEPWIR